MKKAKILMPLIGLTTVSSFVVPAVTSCGSHNETISITMEDISGGAEIYYKASKYNIKKDITYKYTGAKFKTIGTGKYWFVTAPLTAAEDVINLSKLEVTIGGKAATVKLQEDDFAIITPAPGAKNDDEIVISATYSRDATNVGTSLQPA